MKKSDFKYQQNLAVGEFTIPSGGEWLPRLNGWSLILVRQGTGYCLQHRVNGELITGTVLLASGFLQGSIRASQLGELSLSSFNIIPERLTGLITLGEQHLLQLPAASEPLLKILPPDSPVAIKTSELFADKTRRGLLFRLKLLQLFAEFFLDEPRPAEFMDINADASVAMKRLQKFMQELPVSELLEMDFNELAEKDPLHVAAFESDFLQAGGRVVYGQARRTPAGKGQATFGEQQFQSGAGGLGEWLQFLKPV